MGLNIKRSEKNEKNISYVKLIFILNLMLRERKITRHFIKDKAGKVIIVYGLPQFVDNNGEIKEKHKPNL